MPRISKMLVILLPITFPKTISELPLARALIETANSGALVPKATIVNPMSILGTLKFKAVEEAPSTKISAPLIRKIKPSINNKIFNIKIHHTPKSFYHLFKINL